MSTFIGNVKGPNHNSPNDAVDVWCSLGGVEMTILNEKHTGVSLDPIAARNLAALLVRGSEEVERMRDRRARDPQFAADVADVEAQMGGKQG